MGRRTARPGVAGRAGAQPTPPAHAAHRRARQRQTSYSGLRAWKQGLRTGQRGSPPEAPAPRTPEPAAAPHPHRRLRYARRSRGDPVAADRVNGPQCPVPCGDVPGAPRSGTRRRSTWPAGHPEKHRCATAYRTRLCQPMAVVLAHCQVRSSLR